MLDLKKQNESLDCCFLPSRLHHVIILFITTEVNLFNFSLVIFHSEYLSIFENMAVFFYDKKTASFGNFRISDYKFDISKIDVHSNMYLRKLIVFLL